LLKCLTIYFIRTMHEIINIIQTMVMTIEDKIIPGLRIINGKLI